MRTVIVGLVVLALGATLSGCYAATLHTTAARERQEHTGYGVVWFWGMISMGATADCPRGVAYVHTERPWWGALVSWITAEIITPWSISWACVAEERARAARERALRYAASLDLPPLRL